MDDTHPPVPITKQTPQQNTKIDIGTIGPGEEVEEYIISFHPIPDTFLIPSLLGSPKKKKGGKKKS